MHRASGALGQAAALDCASYYRMMFPRLTSGVVAVASVASGLVCPPPCGPFCPMRSSSAVLPSLDPNLELIGATAPLLTERLAALTSELEASGPSEPFAKKCDELGADLEALREDYAAAQATLRASDDFQAREYVAFAPGPHEGTSTSESLGDHICQEDVKASTFRDRRRERISPRVGNLKTRYTRALVGGTPRGVRGAPLQLSRRREAPEVA